MPTIGFSHYNLRAPRDLLDALRDFYCEVVGLAPGARPPFSNFGYWLYAGDHDVLHLSEAAAGDARVVGVKSTFDHVAFTCTGRADAEQRLSRHGIDYRVAVWGLVDTVGYPENPPPQSPWARRLIKAHVNAVENLIVFAPLVLAVYAVGVTSALTAAACMVFFWARVVHVLAHTFAVPWV